MPVLDSIMSGVLPTAAYAIAVALVNEEGTPTNYVNVSNWVYINDNPESNALTDVGPVVYTTKGYSSNTLDPHTIMNYNGAPPNSPSGKGIKFLVKNLDPRYTFVRPVIISRMGGLTTVSRLVDINYDTTVSTEIYVSYTGNETTFAEELVDIIIPRESYTKAKTVAQIDDTLYWGNLEKTQIDINYQPYANNIIIEGWEANPTFQYTRQINGETVQMRPQLGNMRTARNQYYYKSYQRDETYAFYISWILKDGNETVGYHIPGRPALDIPDYAGTDGSGVDLKENDTLGDINAATHNIPALSQAANLPGDMIGKLSTYGANLGGSNNMGYWENESDVYPINANYKIKDHLGTVIGTLEGKPVRHHHFPSSCIGEGGSHIFGAASAGYTGNQMINPLGFKVQNVAMPAEILGKVLGYKIYYAKRTEADSTVLDTGIFNLTPSAHGKPSNTTWGASNSNNWGNALDAPRNGYNVYGMDDDCNSTQIDYAVQNPPGGVDYDSNTGNSVGGSVVCFPNSSVHAPYSDGQPGACTSSGAGSGVCPSTYRNTYSPQGNHFTFNGLHSHVNSPDYSNAAYIKVQRHFRIGRPDSTNAFLGVGIHRKNELGTSYASDNRMSTFFDWTQLTAVDYDDSKTYGTLYNVPPLTNTGPAGSQYPTLLSLQDSMFMPAGVNISPGNSPAGEVINAGGDQTFYLNTHNNLYTHDYSTFISLYYSYGVYKLLTSKQGYAGWGNPPIFNYPNWYPLMSNWAINHWDQTGYGAGTWAFRDMTIQNPTFNNVFNDPNLSPGRSWENGWAESYTAYHFTSGVMDHNTTSALATGYTVTQQEDKIIQYMAYGGVHRYISDIYSTFDLQQELIFTGHTEDTSAYVTPQTINPSSKIFGGDTYIAYYCETRAMKAKGWQFPPGSPSMCAFVGTSLAATCSYYGAGYGNLYESGGNRHTHYTYGIFGSLNGDTHQDITQQLYITESKVNVTMRHTSVGTGSPMEDYYPAVHRQSDSINKWVSGPRIFSYNQDYSSLMNLFPIVAFNHLNKTSNQLDFPTRIIRSVKNNQSGLIDNFRTYLPSQYRDLPRNRGELWNLAIYDNVLLPQTERSLLKTKGKESLKAGEALGDISEIALGDGDLFTHDPNEILYTERGYGGTVSQWSVTVGRYGHLSVDRRSGKIFLLGEKLEEVSNYGLGEFFQKRLTTWGLSDYFLPDTIDMPTMGIGIISTWDPKYNRFIVTKLDKDPTAQFKSGIGSGNITWDDLTRHYLDANSDPIDWEDTDYFTNIGWTMSYYPALKFWASMHDFIPNMYFYSTIGFYSLTNESPGVIYEHNYGAGTSTNHSTVLYNIGTYYGTDYTVEFEYIDNEVPTDNKLYSSFQYTADVDVPSNEESGIRNFIHDSGFNAFCVYNSHQLSYWLPLNEPEGTANQLWTNASVRRKERTWHVRGFRDERAESTLTAGTALDAPINSPILNSNLLSGLVTINTTSSTASKTWEQRRKFVDKWIAIRLIQNKTNSVSANTGNYLVTLHSMNATKRKTYR
jgi:hypothetical protein